MSRLKRNGRMGIATWTALALLAVFGQPWLPEPRAAEPAGLVNTQAVYAAFTLNLIRFVTWPEGTFPAPDAPFVIGTFPRDPINDVLDEAVRGEKVDARPVVTVRIQSLDDLTACHVIFLSRGMTRPAVLARVTNKPILTVSDADGFLEMGGHVRFVPQANGTRLRMSVANLKASGLESRAQLLRLAAAP